jgi:SGNH domain (fused to AT3 domains)
LDRCGGRPCLRRKRTEMLRFQDPAPDIDLAPCRKTIQRGIDYAKSPSVDAVVLSAHWYWYLVDAAEGGKRSTDGVLQELRRLVAEFVNDGKHVYIVLNIPRGDEFDPRQMIQRTLFPPGFKIRIGHAEKSKIVNGERRSDKNS